MCVWLRIPFGLSFVVVFLMIRLFGRILHPLTTCICFLFLFLHPVYPISMDLYICIMWIMCLGLFVYSKSINVSIWDGKGLCVLWMVCISLPPYLVPVVPSPDMNGHINETAPPLVPIGEVKLVQVQIVVWFVRTCEVWIPFVFCLFALWFD